ncbi:class I SAM-dependent methyltransferase [Kutzneria sp. NPDC052558]|uniref:class I SAM-dependent methyltransferase n=1 Tax=Kutzneria sp. NPDC052558 TaxID=3364121 RepID=UPI0037C86697
MLAEALADGRLAGEVLDVGCGTGEHALLCAAAGHACTGIDIAESALEVARTRRPSVASPSSGLPGMPSSCPGFGTGSTRSSTAGSWTRARRSCGRLTPLRCTARAVRAPPCCCSNSTPRRR